MSLLTLVEQAANPSTPSAGKHRLFVDNSPVVKAMDDLGQVYSLAPTSHFRLAANGAAIGPAIADFFGANSAYPFEANSIYELIYVLNYLKTTAGTVIYTLTNTQTYANLIAYYIQGPAAGIATQAAPAWAGVVGQTAAAVALPATASLTTAVNHQAIVQALAEFGTAGNVRLRVTGSAGTVTPLRGSYYYARRLASGNVGSFVA